MGQTIQAYDGNDGLLYELFRKVKIEKDFVSLVVFENCLGDNLLSSLDFPVVFLKENGDCNLSETSFNREMLILYCLGTDFNMKKMEKFVYSLGRLRGSRIIFAWSTVEPKNITDEKLLKLFGYCQQSFLPNAISIYADFGQSRRFFSYKQFPVFGLITGHLEDRIFQDHLKNLQGGELRTCPDNCRPRSIKYADQNGYHVTGYTAKVVESFARKHNAKLVYPFPLDLNTTHSYWDVHNYTISNQIDIPMSLSSPIKHYNLEVYSMVVEQATWFPMIPLSPPTRIHQIFLFMIKSRLTCILIILWLCFSALLRFGDWFWTGQCADSFVMWIIKFLLTFTSTFRGLLGQSVTLLNHPKNALKIIYSLLFISGMFLSTIYIAYLQTFLTSPPKPKEINTFDDLLRSSVRVQTFAFEFQNLRLVTGESFWGKYVKTFKVSNDTLIGHGRQRLDTSAAYTITSSLWPVLDEYQSRLPRLRFHRSPEMYFTKALYLCMPQHEHSIYRNALNVLILELQQSGLLTYWRMNSYTDMVLAGAMNMTREVTNSDPRGLSMNDLYSVWLICSVGLTIGFIVFLGELAIGIFRKERTEV